MFENAPNPLRIQSAPPQMHESPPTPLLLIHDGSGTTFSYFLLGDLRRDVWAIHSPDHGSSVPLEGGINKIAQQYIELMQAAGISGPILLGGWSFGGYMSLAMARLLAGNISSKISVAGLLIIDSPYHKPQQAMTVQPSESNMGNIPTFVTEGLSQSMKTSFEFCEFLLDDWELPNWDGPAFGGKGVRINIAGRSQVLEYGVVLLKPVEGPWATIETTTYEQSEHFPGRLITPPPAVIIRCTQRSPCSQDQYHADILLGWEGTHPDFIKAVIDVDAEHYTIFDHSDQAKMDNLTTQLMEAMEILESVQPVNNPMVN